eukprot:tig00021428_g21175.t1
MALRGWLQPMAEVAANLAVFWTFWENVAQTCWVEGPSMLPTLNENGGDLVLVDKLTPLVAPYERGDVVLFTSPVNPKRVVVKRIARKQGDWVQAPVSDSGETKWIQVPMGHVWMLGDNERQSHDSRHYGPVPTGLIHGRTVCRLLPFSQFGPLQGGPRKDGSPPAPAPQAPEP